MKPIFEKERLFLNKKLGIDLPKDCWRKAHSIFLNPDTKPSIINFKIEKKQFVIKANRIDKVLATHKNRTIAEEIELRKDRLIMLERQSVAMAKDFILRHPTSKIRVGLSGGKDSTLQLYLLEQFVFKELNITDYTIDYNNTTNEAPQLYKYIKRKTKGKNFNVNNPEMGIINWIRGPKKLQLPTKLRRNCCDIYKKELVKDKLNENEEYIIFLGMRRQESNKRKNYTWEMHNDKFSDKWHLFLPIVEWSDEDVWLYLLWKNIEVNPLYEMGFHRTGCLICPFQQDYIDILCEEYFPYLWNRWMKVVEDNYYKYNRARTHKWTLEEWKDRKWKVGWSREQEIIQRKPTEKNVRELAEVKEITIEIARKFFERKCKVCGKPLNPDEVAMSLKLNGRTIETMMCKTHLSKHHKMSSAKYQDIKHMFIDQDCKLF